MSVDRRFLDVGMTILGVVNTPSETPSAGDQYIVGAAGTGAFEGVAANSVARYDGTQWKFSAPRAGSMEALDASAGTIIRYNGTAWETVADFNSFIAPVLDIIPTGDELPEECAAGEVFLNTSDNKLYNAEAENTWDSGTALTSGARYASTVDFMVHESDGTNIISSNVKDGGLFLNKGDGCIYVYDETTHEFKRNGADVTLTEMHNLTAEEVTLKAFRLNSEVATGREGQVILFVGGVSQVAGVDFSASGRTISWDAKGLDAVGLVAGDVFVVHYIKA